MKEEIESILNEGINEAILLNDLDFLRAAIATARKYYLTPFNININQEQAASLIKMLLGLAEPYDIEKDLRHTKKNPFPIFTYDGVCFFLIRENQNEI